MIGYNALLRELKRRAADKPELTNIVSLYSALLSAQAHAEPRHCECTVLAAEATIRLEQGLPILTPAEFRADRVVLATLCHRVCMITATYFPEWAPGLEDIRDWLCREQASILTFAACFLDEGRVRRGEEAGLANPLLAFVFNQALHPFLRQYARLLAPFVDESMWYRPRCPICGGKPDFGALEKITGERRLLCSRCDFEWTFWRVTCPFCGCDDPDKQKCSAPDDPGYRLCLCENCGRYLKTLDLRQVEDERLLVVERNLYCRFAAP